MQEIKKDKKSKKDTDGVASYYESLLQKRTIDVKSHKESKKTQKGSKNLDIEEESKSFRWLTDHSRNFLAAGYVPEGVKAESRIKEISDRAEEILGIKGFSDKFYGYMEKGFFLYRLLFGQILEKKRGLPISCFGSNISDDMGNILYTQSEVGMMSKLGGGTSGYFGNIRHRGASVKNNGEASGSVHIMQLFETMVDVVSQGSVRRGRFSLTCP